MPDLSISQFTQVAAALLTDQRPTVQAAITKKESNQQIFDLFKTLYTANAPISYDAPTATYSFDFNTTNLKITADELNTIQDIDTSASPQFTEMLINSTTNAEDLNGVSRAFQLFIRTSAVATQSTVAFLHNESNGNSSVLAALKSRGSVGTPTPVILGDSLFNLQSAGYDGTQYIGGTDIQVFVDGVVGPVSVPKGVNIFTTTGLLPQLAWEARANGDRSVRLGDNAGVNKFAVRNANGNNQWTVNSEGGIEINTRETATDTQSDNDMIIGVTDTSIARTVTLATADTLLGRVITVKDQSGAAGTNNITVDTEGAQLIDGAATAVINTNYGFLRFYTNGANWFTI